VIDPVLKIDFVIPASPNDAFFSQIAMFRLALDALGDAYREARLVAVFGDTRITPLPDRWRPHFEKIDVEWADPGEFERIGYRAQSERRYEVFRPDADVIVSCDADTLLIRPFEPEVIAAARHGILGGVIAHYHFPWVDTSGDPSADWSKLSRSTIGQEIELLYRYTLMEPESVQNCPFYINLGFLIGSPQSINVLYKSYKSIVDGVLTIVNNYFYEQITVPLAVAKHKIPTVALPMRYNFPNYPIADTKYLAEIKQIRLIHYLRTELFDRQKIFASGDAFEAFMKLELDGSNRIFQDRVHQITGGVYPFDGSIFVALDGDRLSRSFTSGMFSERGPRDAVLVLGMHRSGTSSVAGALVALGGAAPHHLLPPQPDNERGFWESSVLAALDDEILTAGGSHWRDWRAFDPGQIDLEAAVALHARAKAALASEFNEAGLPIIKEPRMCRLMRFWAPVFEEAQWSVRAVLPLRSPLEVARSLNRRDGINVSWGCLLWLRHVLDAEAETRAMPRAVLDWSRFLDDKREALARVTEQLELAWPNGHESAFADIDELVLPSLRHHTATDVDLRAHPAISDLVRETYSAMLELVEDPSNNCLLRRLDDLRARFETAAAIFGEATRELEDDLDNARSRVAERDALAAQLAGERDVLAAQLAVERGATARFGEERGALSAERDALSAERDALSAERDALSAERDALSAERDKFALQLSAAKSENDFVTGRFLEANEQIALAEATIAHIGGRYTEKCASKRSLFRSPWQARWRLLTSLSVNREDLEAIRNSVFFDERHYLETNPDVRATGMDAALHYVAFGGREGRDPGPFFSTEAYLARYPDIAAAGLNPLLHYEAHGRRENRRVLAHRSRTSNLLRRANN
jgi:hypothetical protein